ncbi:MAG: hypothetical protein J6N21_22660, partial [Butyrivibrio sp.]|nr:hypothetical protein [Butyrivibrio sp.]
MNIFFNAEKYIVRVESPRVDIKKPRKTQVLLYLNKYFDMYNHEYLGSVYSACRNYLTELYEDQEQDDNANHIVSAEVQTVTTIIKGLQDYIGQKRHEEMRYEKLLAARQAFQMYCAMISKALEYD